MVPDPNSRWTNSLRVASKMLGHFVRVRDDQAGQAREAKQVIRKEYPVPIPRINDKLPLLQAKHPGAFWVVGCLG